MDQHQLYHVRNGVKKIPTPDTFCTRVVVGLVVVLFFDCFDCLVWLSHFCGFLSSPYAVRWSVSLFFFCCVVLISNGCSVVGALLLLALTRMREEEPPAPCVFFDDGLNFRHCLFFCWTISGWYFLLFLCFSSVCWLFVVLFLLFRCGCGLYFLSVCLSWLLGVYEKTALVVSESLSFLVVISK